MTTVDFESVKTFILSFGKMSDIGLAMLKIVLIWVAMRIGVRLSKIFIDRFFTNRVHFGLKVSQGRLETIKGILKSISRYVIYFVGFVPILDTLGIPVATLLTAAGIGGLAIGFGAQNLVKDVITGFFIIMEDQFAVGDYIELDGKGGMVEEMAVRVTKIRDFSGDLHIIPNGNITMVTNRSRGKIRALVRMSIAYEADIDRALEVLGQEGALIAADRKEILEGPLVLGVTNFGPSEVVITIIAYVEPMTQWEIEREMRKRFKQALDRESIEIPYSKMVVMSPKA